jgi:hypothetical protein
MQLFPVTIIVLGVASAVWGLKIDDYSDTECIVSAKPAVKPEGLEFCHWYNSKSCCVPQLDSDTQEIYGHAVALGLSCSISKHQIKVTYNAVREWYCLGCDPDEPKYRFKSKLGDKNLPGGQADGDPKAADNKVTWRVCKSFLFGNAGNGGLWGKDGSMYDKCGILMENKCDGGKQVVWNPNQNNKDGAVMQTEFSVLQGWDPFMCGDNLIIPSKEYVSEKEPAEAFLRAIPPPGFGDVGFDFVITDDSKADFNRDATPCFRGVLTAAAGAILPSLYLVLSCCLLYFLGVM